MECTQSGTSTGMGAEAGERAVTRGPIRRCVAFGDGIERTYLKCEYMSVQGYMTVDSNSLG